MAEYIIHLKLAQKHILAVSVGKQTNEQIDRLTQKKKITIYGETCVIETTIRTIDKVVFLQGLGWGS